MQTSTDLDTQPKSASPHFDDVERMKKPIPYVIAGCFLLLVAWFYTQHYETTGFGGFRLALIILLSVSAFGYAYRSKNYQEKKTSDEYEAEKEWIKENVRAGSDFPSVKKLIEPKFRLRVSDHSYSIKHGKGNCHDFESNLTDLRILENEGKIVEVKTDANY